MAICCRATGGAVAPPPPAAEEPQVDPDPALLSRYTGATETRSRPTGGEAWRDAPPVPVVGGNEPGYVQSDILPLARRQDVINDPNSHWWQGWALARQDH